MSRLLAPRGCDTVHPDERLQDQIRNGTSAFYSNPVAIEAAIMLQVNADIDVYPVIPPTGVIIIKEG